MRWLRISNHWCCFGTQRAKRGIRLTHGPFLFIYESSRPVRTIVGYLTTSHFRWFVALCEIQTILRIRIITRYLLLYRHSLMRAYQTKLQSIISTVHAIYMMPLAWKWPLKEASRFPLLFLLIDRQMLATNKDSIGGGLCKRHSTRSTQEGAEVQLPCVFRIW